MEGIQDIPRLYTGLAEWMACLVILKICRRRLHGAAFAGVSILMLLLQCAFLVLTAHMPANILWILCMVAAVGLMYMYIYACGQVTPRMAAYCCVSAFLSAEFAASLEWQLHTWLSFFRPMRPAAAAMLLLLVYAIVFSLMWCLNRTTLTAEYLNQLTWNETGGALFIVLAAFALSNLSFVMDRTPFSGQVIVDIFAIRTLADLGGLGALYAYQSRIGGLLAEKELAAVRQVLNSQYEQYRNFQESEEMLHMMQHDLKHQIDGLRAETNRERRTEWLDRMEEELDSWWLPQKTGSPVLDTILAAKLRKARGGKIRMTCVADGSLLSMLHVTDICTIFGNALDNALESVIQIPEEEKRLVNLVVDSRKEFLFIQVSNTCETEIRESEDHTLLTTKGDRKNHGYGLKGIRYSVEKYGGNVSHRLEDGWFELRILIPR